MSFEIGETVGDYQIIALLGRGGMGKVFKVRNTISDRIEAMKVLLSDAGELPDLVERFIREIKVVASLEHPHIAALRTALRLRNQLIMIMEFVEGSSLEENLRSNHIEIWRGVNYIGQVLSALSYAHRAGVVHRDIKPSNILVNGQGVAKLTDFGIASKAGDPRLTATGMALGSLFYMSPEQVRTVPLDARSDLYAVGLVLYELITGRRPIQGDSFFSIMKAQLEVRPVPPVELVPGLPAELSRVIEKSLEKAPEARFQSADEFRNALLTVGGLPSGMPGAVVSAPLTFVPASAVYSPGSGYKPTGIASPSPQYSRTSPQGLTPPYGIPQEPGPQTQKIVPTGPVHTPVPGTRSGASSNAFGQASGFDPAQIERARKSLAVYVGPMAKVIVNRAARQAQSIRQLYEMVSQEIPSPSDRQKFLASCPL